jgi:integrase
MLEAAARRVRRRRADEISLRDVENFAHHLGDRVSIATVNRNLTLLRAIFNRVLKHGRIAASPIRAVKLRKENSTRVRFIEEAEEARLFEALPERFRRLATVALHTGMRRGELMPLRWRDVDFAPATITIREAKSGEGRRIPMNSIARETLDSLRRAQIRQGAPTPDLSALRDGYVFSAVRGTALTSLARAWIPALRRAGIEDFHFHNLRHTFASRLVREGVDLYRVQTLLGHKTQAMTLRYAHFAPDHLREAVGRLALRASMHNDGGFDGGCVVNNADE